MIKLIVSDFDGVLLDLKQVHFDALNKALLSIDDKFVISEKEHIEIFDGLSTKKKLELLKKLKGLSEDKFEEINELKQKYTVELLHKFSEINYNIVNVITSLKQEGYLFYVASNAIKNTIDIGLEKLGIIHLVDKICSNQDIKYSKPSSEIYLQCMAYAGVSPSETVIIEDSKYGREAGVKSGAFVCGADNSFDFTLERINSFINSIKPSPIKWAGKSDVNVLIPMAGLGSRFQAEYKLPKPLIDVNGMPMIKRVIDNLNIDANYIFVVQREHYEKYNLATILPLMVPNCEIVLTEGITEGAACTTLLAKQFINNDRHLVIANSDQIVEWDSCDFMYSMIYNNVDGGILTFKANEEKWSYAKVGDNNLVEEVAEKRVISDDATVGIYYWKMGSDYIKYAEQMIEKNIRTRNEYYVCPVFNEAIQDNKKINIYPIQKMWGLGTPEDYKIFLNKNTNDNDVVK